MVDLKHSYENKIERIKSMSQDEHSYKINYNILERKQLLSDVASYAHLVPGIFHHVSHVIDDALGARVRVNPHKHFVAFSSSPLLSFTKKIE
jgi:hypothetical protein